MFTFHRILEIYGHDPRTFKLVRHGNKEIQVHKTFMKNVARLEAYQSFQKPNKFGKASSIAVFAPYYKTTALFLGIWDIIGYTEGKNFSTKTLDFLKGHELPENWFYDSDQYELERNKSLSDLSERLVIEWGRATVAWVQSKDKEVVEIKAEQSIGDFHSFSHVDLDYEKLKKIMQFPETNLTWMNALSSVIGVYLIRDKVSGKIYVGSAYGESGIYGRWSQYAQNGHGGNTALKQLNPDNFHFSILEIVPATSTIDSIIDCENRWKERLGTRDFGYNNN